ncbi:MAG: hypothetical protein HY335_08620, partial [Deinococcus sp.]|nr:hypothetical protein [Deinococcus sp.]
NSTATRLQVVVFPDILDPGEAAAVIIFASDAFGDPVLDEDMVVSLVSGGGEVLLGGVAVDDGQPLEVTEDVYAADGVYVAEFVASPLVRGPAVLRVVDLSDPTELVVEVGVDVR